MGVYVQFSYTCILCEPEVVFAIKTNNNKVIVCSYTFERVQENSEKLWRFERYTVINDYDWRIPSPINLIFLPYRFIVRPGKQTVRQTRKFISV